LNEQLHVYESCRGLEILLHNTGANFVKFSGGDIVKICVYDAD
jgi:hypothetical protein